MRAFFYFSLGKPGVRESGLRSAAKCPEEAAIHI